MDAWVSRVWLAWECRSSSHLVVLQITVNLEDIRGVSPAHELRDNQEDDQQEKEEHHAHNQLICRQPSSNVSHLHADTASDSDTIATGNLSHANSEQTESSWLR